MKLLYILAITFLAYRIHAQLPNYVPSTNLVAFYSYSGNVLDNSGNGHNNANYNISLATDRFNSPLKSLTFDGNGSEFLNYGDVDDFEGINELTFSFWILPNDLGQADQQHFRPIISKWTDASSLSNSSYFIYLDGSDLTILLTDGTSSFDLKVPISNIPIGQWSNVVFTFENGMVSFYINNSTISSQSSGLSQLNNSSQDFIVGDWLHQVDNTYAIFNGKIDDIGIWNRSLNPCEIEALFTGNMCVTASVNLLEVEAPTLVRIVNLMGQETTYEPNKILIYHYSDGSSKKVFQTE